MVISPLSSHCQSWLHPSFVFPISRVPSHSFQHSFWLLFLLGFEMCAIMQTLSILSRTHLCVHVCVCVCVCVLTSTCGGGHMHLFKHRGQVRILGVFLLYYGPPSSIETGSPTDPGTTLVAGKLQWPPVFIHIAMPLKDVGAGDLSSGPHACTDKCSHAQFRPLLSYL